MFNEGCKFSMHYHMNKDETWYVEEGEFIYRWIDTETAQIYEDQLSEGMLSDKDSDNYIKSVN